MLLVTLETATKRRKPTVKKEGKLTVRQKQPVRRMLNEKSVELQGHRLVTSRTREELTGWRNQKRKAILEGLLKAKINILLPGPASPKEETEGRQSAESRVELQRKRSTAIAVGRKLT
jgi:hypothetical protein